MLITVAVAAGPGAGQLHAQQPAATPPAPAAPVSAVQAATQPVPAPDSAPLLELTMDNAVAMAMDANLGMQSNRMNVDSANEAVAAARASFLPQVGSSISRSSSRSVPQDFTQGSADITSQGIVVGSSLSQVLPTFGTRYDLTWNNNRNSQVGGNPLFNPSLRSSFALNVTQPLWRGLVTDQIRAALGTSQRRRAIADVQVQEETVRLDSTVRQAYLDLVSAIEGLKVAQQNLDIRQKSLADARARVAVGAAAPIELISAEADVASNQEQVLLAQADISTREDVLRTLILDPERPDYWQLHIVPTDTVEPAPRTIDLDAAIRNALENRLDLQRQRRELEISDLSLRVARDAVRPEVDLRANYSTIGSGGTRFSYGEGFPPPVVSRSDKAFGSVLGDTFGAAYPQWTLGVTVAYPLGRSAARANLAQQQVERRQGDLAIRQMEIAIVQQVRDAARQVENSYQRVLVTQTALRASEQQFEAEQRRFTAGLSTTLELQVRQGQLATARTAELNAVIAHNRALINFDRVQKTQ
jgi:outer membrane protein TolC